MEDFELFTLILSALEWRKNGGSIKMLTDGCGAEYFRSRGLEDLWDGGIDTPLDGVPAEIDPFLFWAAGKIWALRACSEPVCHVDCDMIVWKDLSPLLANKEIAVAHRETITPEVYPPKERFSVREGYRFPDRGWDAAPCNTAFLYIKDMNFKNYYINRSLEFMTALRGDESTVVPMVFAEQRLLAICAAEQGKPIFHLLDQYDLNGQDIITHVWGLKTALRADKAKRAAFCRRCADRLRRDFPEWEGALWGVPELINHLC